MAENVKLKDLYADEKVYDGINTVESDPISIPE